MRRVDHYAMSASLIPTHVFFFLFYYFTREWKGKGKGKIETREDAERPELGVLPCGRFYTRVP
jgi:hypothetical protein